MRFLLWLSIVYTLQLMTAVTLVFLPVVIGYQLWGYRLSRTPLTAEELKKSGMCLGVKYIIYDYLLI